MTKQETLRLFDDKNIRAVWDNEQKKWYFLVADGVQLLTDQIEFKKARNYWKVLKNRLTKEGNELVTNCNRLKLLAKDGKMRKTNVAKGIRLELEANTGKKDGKEFENE